MEHLNDSINNPEAGAGPARPLVSLHRTISVLCVYENPLFLDRICRRLEKDGDIFVEISVSATDALHLMTYIRFDVVVTDCAIKGSGGHTLLEAVRNRGKLVPFICFTSTRDPVFERETAGLGRVDFLSFGEVADSGSFYDLANLIRKKVHGADRPMKNGL